MNLQINYEETINVGNAVSNKGSEFQNLLNQIKNTNDELKTSWEGQDAQKYATAVSEQAEEMQKLCDTINEIGEFLVKVGQTYQKVAEDNASAIN